MSRIDEAMRRVSGESGEKPAVSQDLFVPAWSVPERRSRIIQPRKDSPASKVTISSAWRARLADGSESDALLTEQFRRLAASLHHVRQSQPLSSVMVTSSNPGDGKTLTALNLALVLAETYLYRVLLVDADLRRPSISRMVDLPDGAGLGDALRAPELRKLALSALTPRLTLLPAGRPTDNSIQALVSPRMRQILDEAQAAFDWVILDSPPVGPTTDARLLSQMVGGTLFVIRAGKTQHHEVAKAIEVVGRDQILGVVLNDVEDVGHVGYYYGYGGGDADKKR
jgi:capsular exopolysaccharide synthesis family protein